MGIETGLIVGGSILGGALSADASRDASRAQQKGQEAAIEEQRRQFDITQESLRPFQDAGVSALDQQRILLGLGAATPIDPNAARRAELEAQIAQSQGATDLTGGGAIGSALSKAAPERLAELQTELGALAPPPTGTTLSPQEQQAQAFAALTESPGQRFLRERQEKALLRNAAATGGLGGGNVRTALQQQAAGFAQQDIQNQFGRLGQLAGQGQAAATNVGQFGAQAAGQIGQSLGNIGQARGQGMLGQNQAIQQGLSGVFTGLAQGGLFSGQGGFNTSGINTARTGQFGALV